MASGGPGLKRILDTGGLFFKSTAQTGTGSPQNIAHGLKYVPDIVIAYIVDTNSGAAGEVTEGTHTATNVVITAPSGVKYKVIAG